MFKNNDEIKICADQELCNRYPLEARIDEKWGACEEFYLAGYNQAKADSEPLYPMPGYDDGYRYVIQTVIEKMYVKGYCLQYITEAIREICGTFNSKFSLADVPIWADSVCPGGFPERIKRATKSIIGLYENRKLYSIQAVSEQYGISEGDILSILQSHDLSRTETARELTKAMYRQDDDLATIIKAVQGRDGDRYASASQIAQWVQDEELEDESTN